MTDSTQCQTRFICEHKFAPENQFLLNVSASVYSYYVYANCIFISVRRVALWYGDAADLHVRGPSRQDCFRHINSSSPRRSCSAYESFIQAWKIAFSFVFIENLLYFISGGAKFDVNHQILLMWIILGEKSSYAYEKLKMILELQF